MSHILILVIFVSLISASATRIQCWSGSNFDIPTLRCPIHSHIGPLSMLYHTLVFIIRLIMGLVTLDAWRFHQVVHRERTGNTWLVPGQSGGSADLMTTAVEHAHPCSQTQYNKESY